MATEASIGYGSKFELWDGGVSPSVFVELGEITSITPPNEQTDIIDATHMASPDATREYIMGLTDPGETSFEMNFVPGSVSDELIRAVRATRAAAPCRITFPNGVTWSFSGLVTGYEPTAPVDDKMTATVTMKVSSSVTTGGSP